MGNEGGIRVGYAISDNCETIINSLCVTISLLKKEIEALDSELKQLYEEKESYRIKLWNSGHREDEEKDGK